MYAISYMYLLYIISRSCVYRAWHLVYTLYVPSMHLLWTLSITFIYRLDILYIACIYQPWTPPPHYGDATPWTPPPHYGVMYVRRKTSQVDYKYDHLKVTLGPPSKTWKSRGRVRFGGGMASSRLSTPGAHLLWHHKLQTRAFSPLGVNLFFYLNTSLIERFAKQTSRWATKSRTCDSFPTGKVPSD